LFGLIVFYTIARSFNDPHQAMLEFTRISPLSSTPGLSLIPGQADFPLYSLHAIFPAKFFRSQTCNGTQAADYGTAWQQPYA
jgi:hypothetical protein